MKIVSILIKPSSSLCNMSCKYCFYSDVSNFRNNKSFGLMNTDTMHKLIDNSLSCFDEEITINYSFQGGEPLMSGIDYFKEFVSYVNQKKKKNHHINYSLQTNATLLNEEFAAFFSKNNFLLGISLDSYKINNDTFRVFKNGEGTFDSIIDKIKLLNLYHVDFNILCVLTSALSKHAKGTFKFIKNNNFKYIQFIPCLPGLKEEENEYALKPNDLFKFYDELFPLWLKEIKNGNDISINFFDNIISIFEGLQPIQCGFMGKCSSQYVIESDGSVYPCDFYVLDEYKIDNINNTSIKDLEEKRALNAFKNENRILSNQCKECEFYGICHGQCKRLSVCYYNENYCGYKSFLSKYKTELIYLARNRYI